MEIHEVATDKDKREFLEFPVKHYRNSKYWIRPLDKDVEAVFDPKKNKLFRDKKTQCKRWLLKDGKGNIIGRIAAFVNAKTSFRASMKVGGVGFFECIDEQEAANTLIDAAREWLKSAGMEAMDGPINFGERNAFWGVLADGFDIEPVYQMNYNYPYYPALLEGYGFHLYFRQLSYGLSVKEARRDKFIVRYENLAKDPKFSVRHVEKNKLDKYAQDFYEIYNKAWGSNKGVPAISQPQAKAMMQKMKPVIVDYLMMFAYYDEQPIGMYINLPELNQYFKHVNGKLDLLGKLKVLYHQLAKTNHKFYGVVFGVVPEFQGKGVDGALIMELDKYMDKHKQWKDIELTWIGDFNPKMMRIAENLDAKVIKTHHTYRYLFDRNAKFERHPNL